ncbi:MAG: helix-turn-helix domain-containing protein [Acidobacteria bacterium]|nr:helix-turn-helix domain-containing protein [Acidobacteriota bacterium]
MMVIEIVSVPEQAAFYVSDAARYLGISPNTLRKRTDLGLIPARRDENGSRVYLLADLDAYLNSLPPHQRSDYPFRNRPAETGRKRKGGKYERP